MMDGIFSKATILLAAIAVALPPLCAEQAPGQGVQLNAGGRLEYETDDLGNRVIDFSHAGYCGGGVLIPEVAAVVRVDPIDGDDGERIQAAINLVSSLPPDADGFRGAVLLSAGEYQVSGSLRIEVSGVVLRGAGSGHDGTRVIASGVDRRTLIRVHGKGDRSLPGEPVKLAGDYVPVGRMAVKVEDASAFAPGDRILIKRPSPDEWIRELGMNSAPGRTPYKWKAGTVDLEWDRRIVSIDTNTLFLDAPLTTALDPDLGGGTVQRYDWPGRISNCGVEHLRLVSACNPEHPFDEDHAWMAIELDNLEDCWIRNVTGLHFVSSVVDLGAGTRGVTVMDCASLQPVSELGGYRRHSYHTDGQLGLFLRCFAEQGRCDFTVGYMATGPNVFLHCRTSESTDMSGSIGSWASGLLFDNVHVDGGSLALDNLEVRYGGAGWAAANSVLWQSSASRIIVRSPPGALNRGIGVWGEFYGDGRWHKVNEFIDPDSLYRAQLVERLGQAAAQALEPRESKAITESVPELGALVSDWERLLPDKAPPADPMTIRNGWLVNSQGVMTGRESPSSWWRGHLSPGRTEEHPPALTRFLPGRYGNGATDDLEGLAIQMSERNEVQLRHHWGLWYDRRREDHQMIRRMNSDVWPPFFEQPFARSGTGRAWDGLSRYDLTRFNPWYFSRLRGFAEVASNHGLVLVNEMFFQHNIIESGAHWVAYPWRPVNNIQGTDFPEPPPFNGDTIKIGNLFYDIGKDWLRAIHTRYIRQCLDNLSGMSNVIHTTGDEYTGPLSFVEFWLDTIAAWMEEGNPDPVIALSVTKDVQDAILADPVRSGLIDVVEIKYWFNTDNGLYAPAGGEELAPRQHLRNWKGGQTSPQHVANMVRQYRLAFPEKAVVCAGLGGMDGWAVLAGGGSLAPVPANMEKDIRLAIPGMEVIEPAYEDRDSQWILGDGEHYLVYAMPGVVPVVDLRDRPGTYRLRRIDRASGRFMEETDLIAGNSLAELPAGVDRMSLYWLSRITGETP